MSDIWPTVAIGDLFEFGAGKSVTPAARHGEPKHPFLRTSNVFWGRMDLSEVDSMHFTKDEIASKSLRKGDLLVCEGGDIGRAAIWNGELTDCCFQNHIHRLRSKRDNIVPRFYMYYLRAGFTQLGIYEGAGNKTTIPNLSRNRLSALSVPKPDETEQQKIAALLWKIQRAIETEEKLIATARELKQAATRQLFSFGINGHEARDTEVGGIPASWTLAELGYLADITYGAQAAVASATDPSIGTPIFTNINIANDGNIDLGKLRYYAVPESHRERLILRKGDVLFNWRSGSADHVGKTAIFNCDGEFTYSSFILRFRVRDRVRAKFLHRYLNYIKSGGFFSNRRNVSSINSVFNASLAATIPVYLPPTMAEQDKIAEVLECIDRKISLHDHKYRILGELFQTLLHKLMNGEIRVADLDIDISEVTL